MPDDLTKEERADIRALAGRTGVPDAAAALGISRQALLALLAGTPIQDGTIALVRSALQHGAVQHVNIPKRGA